MPSGPPGTGIPQPTLGVSSLNSSSKCSHRGKNNSGAPMSHTGTHMGDTGISSQAHSITKGTQGKIYFYSGKKKWSRTQKTRKQNPLRHSRSCYFSGTSCTSHVPSLGTQPFSPLAFTACSLPHPLQGTGGEPRPAEFLQDSVSSESLGPRSSRNRAWEKKPQSNSAGASERGSSAPSES